MPLFGNKKKKIELPEVVDFSNDTWSFKGIPPVYQIQSDGFSYDIVDADGNDKNAISLGLAGMLVIVLNAKGPKIKEDELLPQFGKVIKTRNWHSMTVKEANFLVQTAIKKLTNSSTSGDVFDLASYAPLEVKRVLLKTLFTMSRIQLPPECREEAEHRIIDDIVPDIFSNPEYELALLTGLIVKTDEKTAETSSTRIETAPMLDVTNEFRQTSDELTSEIPVAPSIPEPEPDSAFAELQKIYGRRIDSPQVRAAAQAASTYQAADNMPVNETSSNSSQQQNNPFAAAEPLSSVQAPAQNFNIPQSNISGTVNEPTSMNQVPAQNFGKPLSNNPFAPNEPNSMNQVSAQNFGVPQPNNPFGTNEPNSMNSVSSQNFGVPQPNNPFNTNEQPNIPQPSAPNFSGPQPNNPFAANQGMNPFQQQGIPQPPAPNYNIPQSNYPYGVNNFQQQGQIPNPGFQQNAPYQGYYQQYQQQTWQQSPQMQQGVNPQNNPQQPYPMQQGWQQNYQGAANMQAFPPNINPNQNNPDGSAPQGFQGWSNRGQNYPPQQSPQQNN